MINLLPEKQKQQIHKEYRIRVHIVVEIFLIITIVIGTLLLIPSYFLSLYRSQAASSKSVVLHTDMDTKERADLEARLKDEKATLRALVIPKNSTNPTSIIALLSQYRTADISVDEIRYVTEEKNEFKVTIYGIAKTRQSLLDYTNALKKDVLIKDLNLPVSNFAKDSNIDFTFDLIGEIK